jgi:hypothetical protein
MVQNQILFGAVAYHELEMTIVNFAPPQLQNTAHCGDHWQQLFSKC